MLLQEFADLITQRALDPGSRLQVVEILDVEEGEGLRLVWEEGPARLRSGGHCN